MLGGGEESCIGEPRGGREGGWQSVRRPAPSPDPPASPRIVWGGEGGPGLHFPTAASSLHSASRGMRCVASVLMGSHEGAAEPSFTVPPSNAGKWILFPVSCLHRIWKVIGVCDFRRLSFPFEHNGKLEDAFPS